MGTDFFKKTLVSNTLLKNVEIQISADFTFH